MEIKFVRFTYFAYESSVDDIKRRKADEKISKTFMPCTSLTYIAPEGASDEQIKKLLTCVYGAFIYKMKAVNPNLGESERRFANKCFAYYTFGDELIEKFGFKPAYDESEVKGKVREFILFEESDREDFINSKYFKNYTPWFDTTGIEPSKIYAEFKALAQKVQSQNERN